jgi:hypothetical protein
MKRLNAGHTAQIKSITCERAKLSHISRAFWISAHAEQAYIAWLCMLEVRKHGEVGYKSVSSLSLVPVLVVPTACGIELGPATELRSIELGIRRIPVGRCRLPSSIAYRYPGPPCQGSCVYKSDLFELVPCRRFLVCCSSVQCRLRIYLIPRRAALTQSHQRGCKAACDLFPAFEVWY